MPTWEDTIAPQTTGRGRAFLCYHVAMSIWQKIKRFFRGKRFLCDTCAYDYPSACSRLERPNATSCPDYRKRF